jgi:hypothetical protein
VHRRVHMETAAASCSVSLTPAISRRHAGAESIETF